MATYLEESDSIKISPTDVRVLVALLSGDKNGYEIAKQLQKDDSDHTPIPKTPLYSSLRGLENLHCIKEHPTQVFQARNAKLYQITSFGKDILKVELKRLHHLLGVARRRS